MVEGRCLRSGYKDATALAQLTIENGGGQITQRALS
jgi:hypothetical protein